jgi:NAD-specific glutamate dehydrogenase
VAHEFLIEVLHDFVVPVEPAQILVATGCENLDLALSNLHDGDIEGPTAEVID